MRIMRYLKGRSRENRGRSKIAAIGVVGFSLATTKVGFSS